jgi:hypothetical protein
MISQHIVYEADATRYEISVMEIRNPNSDYDYQFVVSLVNFGKCFFESNLNFIAEAIFQSKEKYFSSTDCVNIQNGIAQSIRGIDVREVEFDYDNRQFKYKSVA